MIKEAHLVKKQYSKAVTAEPSVQQDMVIRSDLRV